MAEEKKAKKAKTSAPKSQKATKAVKTITSTIEDVQRHIENCDILTGKISIVSRDKSTGEPYAIVVLHGWKYKISEKDMDDELTLTSLANFVDRTVQFVVTGIEEPGIATASRAIAQTMTKAACLKKIESGAKLRGQIVNILPHGAYIDIDGVTGLLKNVDFAQDTTSIKDVHRVGDTLNVKFKKRSSNGTILFEAAKKYVSAGALKIDDLCEDVIVSGVVRAVQPFGVFVQVVVGHDALCSNRGLQELEEDERVSVRITMVDKENNKIRGEILPRS